MLILFFCPHLFLLGSSKGFSIIFLCLVSLEFLLAWWTPGTVPLPYLFTFFLTNSTSVPSYVIFCEISLAFSLNTPNKFILAVSPILKSSFLFWLSLYITSDACLMEALPIINTSYHQWEFCLCFCKFSLICFIRGHFSILIHSFSLSYFRFPSTT